MNNILLNDYYTVIRINDAVIDPGRTLECQCFSSTESISFPTHLTTLNSAIRSRRHKSGNLKRKICNLVEKYFLKFA